MRLLQVTLAKGVVVLEAVNEDASTGQLRISIQYDKLVGPILILLMLGYEKLIKSKGSCRRFTQESLSIGADVKHCIVNFLRLKQS